MASGLRYGVEVRRAAPADGPEVARLLALVPAGGATPLPGEAADRLEALRARADSAVLVTAGYAGLNGLVAVQWAPVLQALRPAAQLTLLVVDADERRRGIGRLLLKAASQAARAAGCDRLDTGGGGAEFAAFCAAAGFVAGGPVFSRSLRKRGGDG